MAHTVHCGLCRKSSEIDEAKIRADKTWVWLNRGLHQANMTLYLDGCWEVNFHVSQ